MDNYFEHPAAFFAGLIGFILAWVISMFAGGFLGFLLGWIPSLIVGAICWLLWPLFWLLVALGVGLLALTAIASAN